MTLGLGVRYMSGPPVEAVDNSTPAPSFAKLVRGAIDHSPTPDRNDQA